MTGRSVTALQAGEDRRTPSSMRQVIGVLQGLEGLPRFVRGSMEAVPYLMEKNGVRFVVLSFRAPAVLENAGLLPLVGLERQVVDGEELRVFYDVDG